MMPDDDSSSPDDLFAADSGQPPPSDLFADGGPGGEAADQESRYVCSSCGHEFAVGQKLKFCSHCGERVRELKDTVQVDTSAKTRVLLVDDSAIARRKVSAILQSLHCDVSEAETGPQAITMATSVQPQLVVLDIHMPQVSGLQVLEALRKTEAFAKTPIVMMTGEADAAVVSQAIALKATDYMRKGDAVGKIAARLQAHLDKLRS